MKGGAVAAANRKDDAGVITELMLIRQLCGDKRREIAAAFEVSVSTVARRLRAARQSELYENARDLIAVRLLPKALAAYEVALEDGNVEVARDIFYGLGVLRKNVEITPLTDSSLESFEVWRARFVRQGKGAADATTDQASDAGSGDAGVVDLVLASASVAPEAGADADATTVVEGESVAG